MIHDESTWNQLFNLYANTESNQKDLLSKFKNTTLFFYYLLVRFKIQKKNGRRNFGRWRSRVVDSALNQAAKP